MHITRNLWKPDTCGCVLEFEFDADLPSEERVHTPLEPHRKCQHHQHADKDTHHAAVSEENTRKNRAFGEVAEQLSDADKKELKWSLDESRQVVIEVPATVDKKTITLTQENARLA